MAFGGASASLDVVDDYLTPASDDPVRAHFSVLAEWRTVEVGEDGALTFWPPEWFEGADGFATLAEALAFGYAAIAAEEMTAFERLLTMGLCSTPEFVEPLEVVDEVAPVPVDATPALIHAP
jgi:hypothetical protein